MSARSLADAKQAFYIVPILDSQQKTDPRKYSAAEILQDGFYASPSILFSAFQWSAADSDTVNEKPLNVPGNAQVFGASNYTAGLTVFRNFDPVTGNADITDDVVYQALRAKGTLALGFLRENANEADVPLADGDDIVLAGLFLTDNPQRIEETSGYIKSRIPLSMQRAWHDFTLGGDSSSSSSSSSS